MEIIKGVIIGLITAAFIAILSTFSGGWLVRALGGATSGDLKAIQTDLENAKRNIDDAHERISGVSLTAEHLRTDEFACGGGALVEGDSLAVMYGSRDGTSCKVMNQNHFKRLILSVPPR